MQAARRQANYQGEVEDLDELIQDAEVSVHFAKVSPHSVFSSSDLILTPLDQQRSQSTSDGWCGVSPMPSAIQRHSGNGFNGGALLYDICTCRLRCHPVG